MEIRFKNKAHSTLRVKEPLSILQVAIVSYQLGGLRVTYTRSSKLTDVSDVDIEKISKALGSGIDL